MYIIILCNTFKTLECLIFQSTPTWGGIHLLQFQYTYWAKTLVRLIKAIRFPVTSQIIRNSISAIQASKFVTSILTIWNTIAELITIVQTLTIGTFASAIRFGQRVRQFVTERAINFVTSIRALFKSVTFFLRTKKFAPILASQFF